MKHINILLTLIVIGCQTSREILLPQQINVSELKSLLPPQLSKIGEKYAIYKDDSDKEYRVKIVVENNFNQLGTEKEKYKAEQHVLNYEFSEKNLTIKGQISSNFYGIENQPAQSMTVGVANYKINPLLGITIFYDYQTKSISILSSPKLEKDNILNKTFQNVYYTNNTEDVLYKNLKFNFNQGVVSFSDLDGKIYVFDRFE